MFDAIEMAEWIEEQQNDHGKELQELGDDFRPALVGIVDRCSFQAVFCYDYDLCIDVLMKQGMSYENAADHFSYNIEGAYTGERTPMILRRVPGNVIVPTMIEVVCERELEEGEEDP
jgi:hypothetical protein